VRIKILFVIDSLGGGGTERSLAELLPYLTSASFPPIIVCFYRREGVENEVISQGYDVRFLKGAGMMAWVKQLRQIIKIEQPDIIHTMLFNADLAGRLAAVGSSAAVVSSLVNTPYAPVRFRDPKIKAYKLRALQMIDAFTSRFLTTHFHAVSRAVKDAAVISLKIPVERITVVERGRSPDRLGAPSLERRWKARQQLDLAREDEVIVNLGRHEYQKGQKYLLEAMAKLTPSYPRLTLLVAGREGNLTPELENQKRSLALNGQVRFLGYREDVSDILAAADLFVFPSLYEGLPGAVIEAMALGLPIVASNIPPVREVVEENRNAILVAPASSSELAKAIASLLADRDKVFAFGRHSRKIFETNFTLQQSATRMIELYQRIVTLKKSKQENPKHTKP
jgi:glycosyltransferase involved in cell wall biosynthesis